MADILNSKKVLRAIEKLERESKRKNNGNVVVGYNASYAIWVHEMLEKHAGEKRKGKNPDGSDAKGRYWDPQGRGQSKYLEQPARELAGEMGQIVIKSVQNGASLINALLTAGRFLQRESQKLVPVDTANLKQSAFTEKE